MQEIKIAVKGKQGFIDLGKNIGTNTAPVSVKYPRDIDLVLRSLPDRSEYIREAVRAKLKADGLI